MHLQAPPKGQSKPMSFQKLLLNTCQDQFESTTDARAVSVPSPDRLLHIPLDEWCLPGPLQQLGQLPCATILELSLYCCSRAPGSF